jgi:hypothetical protein
MVLDDAASCWHTLDPHTRLLTSDDPAELIGRGILTPEQTPGAGELLVRSEYMIKDVDTFAGLAAKRVPVWILDHPTRGNPESSPRYRDLLLPLDIPHELRAAFVIRGRVWGAVHIARRGSSGSFQQQDADALAAITGAVARGIRTSLRFDAARRINGLEAPCLVVLGPGDEVEMITPPARELLASIAASDIPDTDDDMPAAVLSLAGFVRRAPHAATVRLEAFDKVGVASRQELVARVFLDEYLPEVAQSTPLTSRGRFDRIEPVCVGGLLRRAPARRWPFGERARRDSKSRRRRRAQSQNGQQLCVTPPRQREQSRVEGDDAHATPASERQQVGIGDLSISGHARDILIAYRDVVHQEGVSLHGTQRGEDTAGGLDADRMRKHPGVR